LRATITFFQRSTSARNERFGLLRRAAHDLGRERGKARRERRIAQRLVDVGVDLV